MKTILLAAAVAALTVGAQAQTTAPTQAPAKWTTLTLTADVAKPAYLVWDKIGGNQWCGIAKYLDVKGCEITSGRGEVGSLRSIDTGTTKVVEIAVARTPYSYTYAQPFTPIFYHGTLGVEAVDAEHSKIVYTLIWNESAVGDDAAQAAARTSRQTRFQAAVDKMKAAAEAN